ncbi:hypothetical protein SFR_3267 [Streptomyces sp. FR-008]|nr:hypothetical protein SFR_3267 [Streptomyces sp. FR-008]
MDVAAQEQSAVLVVLAALGIAVEVGGFQGCGGRRACESA